MSIALFALLTAAGVAAGLTGTVAGLASLFSYPALLAAGLSPTTANVTNTVSLAVGNITVVPSSRRELTGQFDAVVRLGVACAAGSAAGAALLLITPPGMFERIVPFLVGGASLLILGRGQVDERAGPAHAGGRSGGVTWPSFLGMCAVSLYGGYFAAASGVVMLALLLATRASEGLLRGNALKNVLVGVADVVAAVGFALFGHVAWAVAVPLTLGLLLGSWLGPPLARRLPTGPLRVGIALAGLGLAVKLGFDAF